MPPGEYVRPRIRLGSAHRSDAKPHRRQFWLGAREERLTSHDFPFPRSNLSIHRSPWLSGFCRTSNDSCWKSAARTLLLKLPHLEQEIVGFRQRKVSHRITL